MQFTDNTLIQEQHNQIKSTIQEEGKEELVNPTVLSSKNLTLQDSFSHSKSSQATLVDESERILQENARTAMRNTLQGFLIEYLRPFKQVKFRDIVEHVNKNKNIIVKPNGKPYTGNIRRVVKGALNSSNAFESTGVDVWSLNHENARDMERDIYERFISQEKTRKRRRKINPKSSPYEHVNCTPEEMNMCLASILHEIRQQQKRDNEIFSFNHMPPVHIVLPEEDDDEIDNNDDKGKSDKLLRSISEESIDTSSVNPFSFLENDPFQDISVQARINELSRKLGDEKLCFIMQFFNFFKGYLTNPYSTEQQNIDKFNSIMKYFQSDANSSNMMQSIDMDEFGSGKRQQMMQPTFMEHMNINPHMSIPQTADEMSHYQPMPQMPSIVSAVPWQSSNRELIQHIVPPLIMPVMSSMPTNVPISTTYEGDQSLVPMGDKIETSLVSNPPLNSYISSHPPTSNSM